MSRASILPFVAVISVLAGCGSGSRPAASRTGSILFKIDWPESSRLLPKASKSLKFVAYEVRTGDNDPPSRLGETVAVRPSGGGPQTVLLASLPPVPVHVVITAQPQRDGSGVAQASGTVDITIKESKTENATVTLETTIAEVRLGTPVITRSARTSTHRSPLALEVGQKATIQANGYDSAGNLVLTDSSKWTWSSNNSVNASVASSGQTGTISGVNVGAAIVVVRETESNKSGQIDVTVTEYVPPTDCDPVGVYSGSARVKSFPSGPIYFIPGFPVTVDKTSVTIPVGSGSTVPITWTNGPMGPAFSGSAGTDKVSGHAEQPIAGKCGVFILHWERREDDGHGGKYGSDIDVTAYRN